MSARKGILSGGNWIVDKLKFIDTYPQQDALANILTETTGNGGSPHLAMEMLRQQAGIDITHIPYKGNGLGYLANPRQARRYNPTQVFTQKFDGSARVQLTQTNYSHRDVQVSPDGKWVAFVAEIGRAHV